MKHSEPTVAVAIISLCMVAVTGYRSFGVWPTTIFMVGYLPGFLLWLLSNNRVPWEDVKVPYLAAFTLYVLHLLEENLFAFHDMLSALTGVTSPGWTLSIVILMVFSIGIWVIAPFLIKRGHALGWFFAWTFFGAMGLSEMAHFVFPFLTGYGYEYHGGLVTAVFLVPAGWWGMWRLWHGRAVPRS